MISCSKLPSYTSCDAISAARSKSVSCVRLLNTPSLHTSSCSVSLPSFMNFFMKCLHECTEPDKSPSIPSKRLSDDIVARLWNSCALLPARPPFYSSFSTSIPASAFRNSSLKFNNATVPATNFGHELHSYTSVRRNSKRCVN